MAWAGLPTPGECISCRTPYSFYFDLIGRHWRTVGADPLPLHRACTLARKQGVSYIIIEDALNHQGVREDLDALDLYKGGGGVATAIAISFFACASSPEEISSAPEDSLIGQVILINYQAPGSPTFTRSYVYEAILRTPRLVTGTHPPKSLLNNYISSERDFIVNAKGRDFVVGGIYYCQQTQETNVCAHACLRMALNTLGQSPHRVTGESINRMLGTVPPIGGLSLGQFQTIINSTPGLTAHVESCAGLTPAQYVSVLSSIVESGHLALLVFTTSSIIRHVVMVFGHTRNSDEWHPQAIPAYAGPNSALYYRSSSWIDHFLIHDDNFGPYYALSSRALEEDQNVRPEHIIAITPHPMNIRADFAETSVSIILPWIAQQLPSRVGKWLDYMKDPPRPPHHYIMRTLLISRDAYEQHLRATTAHDGSVIGAATLASLSTLPERFWMVEFSLAPLYTGNLSKLGEMLFDSQSAPDPANLLALLLAARLPGVFILKDASGQLSYAACDLQSHSAVYRHQIGINEW
jgi:hypothetical protein